MARQLGIVLDTCALIWWSLDPERLSQAAKQACDVMEQEKNGYVTPHSLLRQARHQRDQIARTIATVQLPTQNLIPAITTGPRRPR